MVVLDGVHAAVLAVPDEFAVGVGDDGGLRVAIAVQDVWRGEWAAGSLNSVPQDKRVLFTSHDAFGYFSSEFGVRFEGAALSDFNAQQDATADKIKETADKVKASGAVAIFAENSNNPKSVQKVAEVAGVKAVIGDEALYGDSLGTPGSDGETYIGSILHNVSNLTKAWGGTVSEIPADLSQWTPKSSDVK